MKTCIDDDCLLPSDFCEDGHSTQKLERMIIWASTNTLINNYCSMENNVLAETRTTGKDRNRKRETVSKKKLMLYRHVNLLQLNVCLLLRGGVGI